VDDLSLHILDVAENSVTAGATVVGIKIAEQPEENLLTIEIADNGRGMDAKTMVAALDPFMTTKQKKKNVGLGLPFFKEAAQFAGGDLIIESTPGVGTQVTVTMQYNHIDRRPLGNIVDTLMTLIIGYPQTDFHFEHIRADRDVTFATWDLKEETGFDTLSSARAITLLKQRLTQAEASLK
jgi:light-regulated signal transduction histidine kinase (bacteriophytochrome)